MPQFVHRSYARGVKLTIDHLYTPLATVETALDNATVQDTALVPWKLSFSTPFLSSDMFEETSTYPDDEAQVMFPFVMPPLQGDFDRSTLQLPRNFPVLREISIGWDQAAEPVGITDMYCSASGTADGKLTATNMDRYTTTVRLLVREPTLFGGSPYEYQQVLSLEIPGETYGNPYFRLNPDLIDELQIPINPYKAYYWSIKVPGLFSDNTTTERLAMPSFTLTMRGTLPKLARDTNENPAVVAVQNIPTNTYGLPQTGSLGMTTPAADALIDGSTDIQDTYKLFDAMMSNKLRSGVGAASGGNKSPGLEGNPFPWEQLAQDSGYSIIVVPLWGGYGAVRASNVPTAFLPYVGPGPAPYTLPTCDTRVIKVPDGFVLHHAVAAWNLTSYACPTTKGHIGGGSIPTSAQFVNSVGIALGNGIRGDDYSYQQVAYVAWTGANYANYQIDRFAINETNTNFMLMHIPLVAPVGTNDLNSYYLTGKPFYMGGANSITADRQDCGVLPEAFGGGAYQTPDTKGVENFVEIRWRMRDPVAGLDDPAAPTAVRIGANGHYVLLIGKQTITG